MFLQEKLKSNLTKLINILLHNDKKLLYTVLNLHCTWTESYLSRSLSDWKAAERVIQLQFAREEYKRSSNRNNFLPVNFPKTNELLVVLPRVLKAFHMSNWRHSHLVCKQFVGFDQSRRCCKVYQVG